MTYQLQSQEYHQMHWGWSQVSNHLSSSKEGIMEFSSFLNPWALGGSSAHLYPIYKIKGLWHLNLTLQNWLCSMTCCCIFLLSFCLSSSSHTAGWSWAHSHAGGPVGGALHEGALIPGGVYRLEAVSQRSWCTGCSESAQQPVKFQWRLNFLVN